MCNILSLPLVSNFYPPLSSLSLCNILLFFFSSFLPSSSSASCIPLHHFISSHFSFKENMTGLNFNLLSQRKGGTIFLRVLCYLLMNGTYSHVWVYMFTSCPLFFPLSLGSSNLQLQSVGSERGRRKEEMYFGTNAIANVTLVSSPWLVEIWARVEAPWTREMCVSDRNTVDP